MKQGDWSHAYQELDSHRRIRSQPIGKHNSIWEICFWPGASFSKPTIALRRFCKATRIIPRHSCCWRTRTPPSATIRKRWMKRTKPSKWIPAASQSYLNVAVIQEKNKDLAAAEESYKKAVSLDPKSTSALMALGAFLPTPETLGGRRKTIPGRDYARPAKSGARAQLLPACI